MKIFIISIGYLLQIHCLESNRWAYSGDRDVARYQIFNHTLFQQNDKAVQIAYIVVLTGIIKDGYLHHFQFVGHYLNQWIRKHNHWKMINYSIYGGYDFRPIHSQKEAPWRLFSSYEGFSEEEKIIDLYNRYAWGIDENDFEITASALSVDVTANIPGCPFYRPFYKREELLALLKSKRDKENTMSHVGKITGMELLEEKIKLMVWRYEPHRIGTHILHAGNLDTQFYSVKYVFHGRKTSDGWKINRLIMILVYLVIQQMRKGCRASISSML